MIPFLRLTLLDLGLSGPTYIVAEVESWDVGYEVGGFDILG